MKASWTAARDEVMTQPASSSGRTGAAAGAAAGIAAATLSQGQEALFRAVVAGDAARVQALLDGGIDPNFANHHGTTPLHIAVTRGWGPVIKALLAAGADPLARNRAGLSPADIGMFMDNIGLWS